MHAFLLRASWKSSRTIRAPSPTYFCTSSLPNTRMNVASVRFATARAESVFPVPGGPYSNTPFGGSMPRSVNRSGCSSGVSTTSRNSRSASSQPPTSSYVTSGFSSISIIDTEASIELSRAFYGGDADLEGTAMKKRSCETATRLPTSMSTADTVFSSPETILAYCGI